MPFYRINGMVVHVKGSKKLPPACRALLGMEGTAQDLCGAISGFYCDWPAGGGRTCDAALCEAHAFEVGKNRHYCPAHRQDHQDAQAQRGLFTSLV